MSAPTASEPPEAKRQKIAEAASINAQLPDSVVTDCSTLRAVLEREGLLPALLVRDTRAWDLTSAGDKIKLDLGAGGDAVDGAQDGFVEVINRHGLSAHPAKFIKSFVL